MTECLASRKCCVNYVNPVYYPVMAGYCVFQGASEKDIVHSGLSYTMETSARVSDRTTDPQVEFPLSRSKYHILYI